MKLRRLILLILAFAPIKALYAVVEHTGIWTGFAVVGPTRFGPDIKYYYDAQIQLIDSPYKFDEVYGSLGLGKQINDKWLLFLVNTFSISENLSGQIHYEDKIYEEANWRTTFAANNIVSTRSRLEERIRFSESGINLRLRERLMFRFPLNCPKHAFVIYDEIFFNLTRPEWVADRVFEQNRLFVGIGIIVSKKMTLDIGYLNKLNIGSPSEMTNILLISFNITGKSYYIKE